MGQSKRYSYSYEEYEDEGKNASTMFEEILADEELAKLDEIVIGCWGNCWEDSVQPVIDGIVANPQKFSHIRSLFFGDMDFEECEVSWIIQADYSKLWSALPDLEKVTIKGSTDLVLGEIEHAKLKHLEIICGGLPEDVIEAIGKAKLPELETLLLYLGVEDYGFDGNAETIKKLLSQSDFPKLTYLGLTDSELEDEIAELVLQSKYIDQIETLDLSNGTLTDKGGEILLEKLPAHANVKKLNLEYHFLSDEMMEDLCDLSGIEVNVDDQQEADEYDGELYYYPMLTE